jgi:hypothetical protein
MPKKATTPPTAPKTKKLEPWKLDPKVEERSTELSSFAIQDKTKIDQIAALLKIDTENMPYDTLINEIIMREFHFLVGAQKSKWTELIEKNYK